MDGAVIPCGQWVGCDLWQAKELLALNGTRVVLVPASVTALPKQGTPLMTNLIQLHETLAQSVDLLAVNFTKTLAKKQLDGEAEVIQLDPETMLSMTELWLPMIAVDC